MVFDRRVLPSIAVKYPSPTLSAAKNHHYCKCSCHFLTGLRLTFVAVTAESANVIAGTKGSRSL